MDPLVLESFRRASARVPAYRQLLVEHGIDPASVTTQSDFERLPVLEKRGTFQRFAVADLCLDGTVGDLGSVLTSSGHSGIFAFGLSQKGSEERSAAWIDANLDAIFRVRSHPTLLINCLPMGVKVPTRACTLAETSVREDMVVGLVKAFAAHFAQIILVGEAAFVKRALEFGAEKGVRWSASLVHVILGEEMLAENARTYLSMLLADGALTGARGLILSSMGVGEVGLNLFSEVTPAGPLVPLRRLLHQDSDLRAEFFGPRTTVPSLFAYDPSRIFVEFDSTGRLILTTLDESAQLPLIRYATGDTGAHFRPSPGQLEKLARAGVPEALFGSAPLVAIDGRGQSVTGVDGPVFPEEVKEGIYAEPDLAALTTANFRLRAEAGTVLIRVQLRPGLQPPADLDNRFTDAISRYVRPPFQVGCEAYATFGSGMTLDFERKLDYLGP